MGARLPEPPKHPFCKFAPAVPGGLGEMVNPKTNEEAMETLFRAVGCDESTVLTMVKNEANARALSGAIHDARLDATNGPYPAPLLKALVAFSTKVKETPFVLSHRGELMKYIVDGKLKTQPQLNAAFKYFAKQPPTALFDRAAFEVESGVGIEVSAEEICDAVAAAIDKVKDELIEERYHFKIALLQRDIDAILPWAEGKDVRVELDRQVEAFLGPKTEDDLKKKKKKKAQVPDEGKLSLVHDAANFVTIAEEQKTNEIEKLYAGRGIEAAKNSPEIMVEHNKITGGRLRTRFPPEPNGYLHIGHAKAMNFNFGLAYRHGGECYLRYDDTNPSSENMEYVNSIKENVEWLGHTPAKITFSSDCFEELYQLAVKLIKVGKAYVCHQTQAEIREARLQAMQQPPSPYRDRSVDENLRLFDLMRKGAFAEGEATLRMKMDIRSPNPCMWDTVAYRIKYEPHQHSGNNWCIYPSYDYTHCLVDSIEHVSHSLCTLEFEVRRDSYYWLLEALDLYRPTVWEYSRLNITKTVLSKRKLKQLVEEHHVRSWDDPRLLTINGLRRRGYTPSAINEFCERVGVTRATNVIRLELLESVIRAELDAQAPRTMVVLQPLKVVITNFPNGDKRKIDLPLHPKDASLGTRTVEFGSEVWIEQTDFRVLDEQGYYGLAPGKTARLRNAFNIRCERVLRTDPKSGQPLEIECTYDSNHAIKCKGNLHWVAVHSSANVQVRLYDDLFLSDNPSDRANFLDDINPNSLVVCNDAKADRSFVKHLKTFDRFQFERTGYFVVDTESTIELPVFNRIVSLRESKEKKAIKS